MMSCSGASKQRSAMFHLPPSAHQSAPSENPNLPVGSDSGSLALDPGRSEHRPVCPSGGPYWPRVNSERG